MKLAIFSDIHGHLAGLRAVLAAIDRLGGADAWYAAGDILLGGAGAEDLLELLQARGGTCCAATPRSRSWTPRG